jgi:hypothetical protein
VSLSRFASTSVSRTATAPAGRRRTADFKGQFRTRDGAWCYPLTIADQASRYLLRCQALPSVRTEGAKPVFERLFREVGLPAAIRTDNGAPYASTGIQRRAPPRGPGGPDAGQPLGTVLTPVPGPTAAARVSRTLPRAARLELRMLSQALEQQWIGLEETEDGVWSVYFHDVLIARLDERSFDPSA